MIHHFDGWNTIIFFLSLRYWRYSTKTRLAIIAYNDTRLLQQNAIDQTRIIVKIGEIIAIIAIMASENHACHNRV